MLCLLDKQEGSESSPFLGYNAPIGFIFIKEEKKKLSCHRDECLKHNSTIETRNQNIMNLQSSKLKIEVLNRL
jgi:hypothetical protein